MINLPNIVSDISKVRSSRWGFSRDPRTKTVLKSLDFDDSNNKQYFSKIWRVKDSDSVDNAKRVDIVQEIEKYGEDKSIFLNNLLAIELTTGCNGGCYYCVSGQKFKIYEKYTFKSLKKFYQKYSHLITNKNKPLIYWDSDSFIYQDGKYDLRDIYDVFLSRNDSKFVPFISTTIPPGSQLRFLNFAEHLYKNYYLSSKKIPTVRISLGKHNVLRIELVVLFTYLYLLKRGYPAEKVISFFNKMYTFDIRDEETVMNVGPLIKLGDTYQDIISPNTDEGFILAPNTHRVLAMASATKEVPLGARVEKVNQENIEEVQVKRDTFYDYTYYFYDTFYIRNKKDFEEQINNILKDKKIFLREIDRSDDLYHLSRMSLSFRHYVTFFSQLDIISEEVFKEFVSVSRDQYFSLIKDLITTAVSQLKQAKNKDILASKHIKLNVKIFLFQFALIELLFLEFTNKNVDKKRMVSYAKQLLKYSKRNEVEVLSIAKTLAFAYL